MDSSELAAAVARLASTQPASAPETATRVTREVHRFLLEAANDQTEDLPTLVSEHTPRGARSLRLGAQRLHSAFDPRREATRFIATLEGPAAPDAIVCFGFGAGHYLTAVRERWRGVPLMVVVPNPAEVLLAALEDPPDWWATIAPFELVAASEIEDAIRQLQTAGHRAVVVVSPRPFREAYPAAYELFEETVNRYRTRVDVNSNTVHRFGRRWVANLLDNALTLAHARPIEQLFEVFRSRGVTTLPVIVCGAGPTLEQAIPWLAAARGNALLLAVDTAAARLVRSGIQPDMVVVVDPQYWNTRHLDSLFGLDLPLITEPAVHPRVVRRWRGPVFTSASLFPLGRHLYNDGHKLGAGGSVATSAWDLARVLGGKPIYLCGVDLGFPEGNTHCRDSFFESLLVRNATRLAPSETGAHAYLTGVGMERVATTGGPTTIWSDPRMAVYRGWFAEQMRLHPAATTFQLSPETSAITGIGLADSQQILRGAEIRAALDAALAALRGDEPRADARRGVARRGDAWCADSQDEAPPPTTPPPTTQARLSELGQQLSGLREIATAGVAACAMPAAERLVALQRVDAALHAHPLRDVAGFLAWRALEEASNEGATTLDESFAQSRRIYEAIAASAGYQSTRASRLVTRTAE